MSDATWNQFYGTLSWASSQLFDQEPTSGQITWTDGESTSGWSRIERELLAMEGLFDNWDNMGAVAPDPALIDSAARFLHRLQSEHLDLPDMVMPGPEGTIIFAWHWAPGSTLEAEIGEPGVAELFSKEAGMEADTWLYEFDNAQPGDAVWEVSADAVTQAA